MTAARAALGCLLALSGFRTASAEPCAARAELSGEAASTAAVQAELARLDVGVGKLKTGCPGVVAQIEREPGGGGLAVVIRDRLQRTERRIVSDASVAATWIDSWLRDDPSATSIPTTAGSPSATATATSTPSTGVALSPPATDAGRHAQFDVALTSASRARTLQPPGLVPSQDATPPKPRLSQLLAELSLAVSYEQGWASGGDRAPGVDTDGRSSGFGVAACVKTGGMCLGARLHHAREADQIVNLTGMARGDTSALATAARPIAVGKMVVTPELGLGVGRMWTRRVESCVAPSPDMTPPNCDPTDPMTMCEPPPPVPMCSDPAGKVFVGDGLSVATITPRASAAVRVAVPLFDHVWLDALASFTMLPFGHGTTYAPAVLDPTGQIPPDAVTLPGEPDTSIQLGIGIRVGAP
ncbi:MAG TPA: hypothetical protein VFQ53_20775 [Kofleriaceae bacterium]|nr:hypothetical protein [Kofleriaceae bacterium]